jgi:hypothetical protein
MRSFRTSLRAKSFQPLSGTDLPLIDRGDGSHRIYYHPDGRRVTVSFHGAGSTFRRKTLKSMVGQARWTNDDPKRLKLI